jgi:competence protein ComEC
MNPHRVTFSRHPLAQVAVALAAGICVASYFQIGLVLLCIVGAVCAAVVVCALVGRRVAIAGVALLLAVGVAGAVLAVHEQNDQQRGGDLREFLGRSLVLTGVVSAAPELGWDRAYLTLRVERLNEDGIERNASGVVSLLLPLKSQHEYFDLQLRYGARIRVAATLNRADKYRNPGVSPLSEYLDRKGYDATGVVKSAAVITRLDDERGLSVYVLGVLYSWREHIQREIDTKFRPETAGVLDAALLGNRYNLSRETSESFREGGTFHVLVISGLHISFIGGVVYLALRRLTRRRTRQHAGGGLLQFAVPVTVVWAYSLAVGAESSVVRAALMFTFAGLALVIFRESSSLNALGAAALILLIQSPKNLFDPSFQLTFVSVLAIVSVAWPLLQTCAAIGSWYPSRDTPSPPVCSRGLRWFCEDLFWSERKWQREIARSPYRYRLFKSRLAATLERYRVQSCLRYIFGAIVVSGAVQLLLLPLMIVYFHRLSPASLLLNIVVSILLAILTAVALLALIIAPLSSTLAAPLFHLADTINWLMIHSVDPFASLNLASIRLPEYSGWGALSYPLYYVPLLALIFKNKRWFVPAALTQILFVVFLILHPYSARFTPGQLRVDFLDVGQGDAALITMPDGSTLLVDAGGAIDFSRSKTDRRSIGEAVVSEYLWWRGLDTVDYVLATHADADHIDGLNDVLRNFHVQSALVARTPAPDPEWDKFSHTLVATRTDVTRIQAGDLINFGNVTIEVLWPPAASNPNAPSRNNDSIVLHIRYGNRSLLLTGDIEKNAEQALLSTSFNLQSDVIKVPHHGSRSSSTEPFVVATKPDFAIISVGQDSMFGHPHREVVERWQANGAQVLTTGHCGTITVTTDGTDFRVTGMQSHISPGSLCPVGR